MCKDVNYKEDNMALVKNEYPILEYDRSKMAIIEPNRSKKNKFPEYCVLTFFGEVLEKYLKTMKNKIIGEYKSEMRTFPVYEIKYKDIKICLIQAVVGSASIAMMMDWLIGGGVKYLKRKTKLSTLSVKHGRQMHFIEKLMHW